MQAIQNFSFDSSVLNVLDLINPFKITSSLESSELRPESDEISYGTTEIQNEDNPKISLRNLQSVANNPLYPNYRPGEATFLDQYCKYGCVVDALTAPLFYRPFYGYGYPMIGNELLFPAGYGGNGSIRTADANSLAPAMALVQDALAQQQSM